MLSQHFYNLLIEHGSDHAVGYVEGGLARDLLTNGSTFTQTVLTLLDDLVQNRHYEMFFRIATSGKHSTAIQQHVCSLVVRRQQRTDSDLFIRWCLSDVFNRDLITERRIQVKHSLCEQYPQLKSLLQELLSVTDVPLTFDTIKDLNKTLSYAERNQFEPLLENSAPLSLDQQQIVVQRLEVMLRQGDLSVIQNSLKFLGEPVNILAEAFITKYAPALKPHVNPEAFSALPLNSPYTSQITWGLVNMIPSFLSHPNITASNKDLLSQLWVGYYLQFFPSERKNSNPPQEYVTRFQGDVRLNISSMSCLRDLSNENLQLLYSHGFSLPLDNKLSAPIGKGERSTEAMIHLLSLSCYKPDFDVISSYIKAPTVKEAFANRIAKDPLFLDYFTESQQTALVNSMGNFNEFTDESLLSILKPFHINVTLARKLAVAGMPRCLEYALPHIPKAKLDSLLELGYENHAQETIRVLTPLVAGKISHLWAICRSGYLELLKLFLKANPSMDISVDSYKAHRICIVTSCPHLLEALQTHTPMDETNPLVADCIRSTK